MTRQSPFFFDQIVESTRIIFGSRLLQPGPHASLIAKGCARFSARAKVRSDRKHLKFSVGCIISTSGLGFD